MVVFSPFLVFYGIFLHVFDKFRFDKIFLSPSHDKTSMSVFLFILYLPWNILITIIMLLVCSLSSLLCIPVLIWPSIYYNVRRFRRTMDYWSGKSRLNQQVQVDKIVARRPQ